MKLTNNAYQNMDKKGLYRFILDDSTSISREAVAVLTVSTTKNVKILGFKSMFGE